MSHTSCVSGTKGPINSKRREASLLTNAPSRNMGSKVLPTTGSVANREVRIDRSARIDGTLRKIECQYIEYSLLSLALSLERMVDNVVSKKDG